MKVRWAVGVAIVAGAGCVLDIPDVIDGGGSDVESGDASDASNDVLVPPVCDASCGAPSGFSAVLFDPVAGGTACPAKTSATDVVYNPGAVPSSACACSCAVTTPPSCTPTSIAVTYGTTTCNTSGGISNLTGGCDPASYSLVNHAALVPPQPVDAGACTSAAVPDAGGITVSRARLCVPTECTASSCSASGSLELCFLATGDVQCPSNQTAYHVGTSLQLSCAPCGACTMANGPCGGTVSFYSDGTCGALIRTNPVDGTCVTQTQSGQAVASQKYTPSIDAGCSPGTSGSGTVALATPMTVCCP